MAVPITEHIRAASLAERPTNAAGSESTRIHYLDNLRATAMLLGVYLHSALAYAQPAQSVWLATDSGSSTLVDASIWFIHLFRMSLFFLLSGYFAKLVIQKKGLRLFLCNRALRIAVPFVTLYPFLLAAMFAVIVFSLSYLDAPRGLMGLIAESSRDGASARTGRPLTTMHLWFLYYLLMFAAISAVVSRVSWCQADWLIGRPMLLVFVPLVLLPAVLAAGIPLPAPESFVPHWWPFVFYGSFYGAGWILYRREHLLDRLQPLTWHLVWGSLGAYSAYYATMPKLDLSLITAGTISIAAWDYPLASVLTAYLSVSLTISVLLLGRIYLVRRSPALAFVADSSYWMYLIHLPVVIFLQVLLIPLDWPAVIKLVLTLLGTTGFCMATYVVFVRYTPIGNLLHGKRSFP